MNSRVLIGYENGISKIERYNFIAKMKDSDVLDNDVSIYVLCMKVEQEEEYDEFHDVLMQVLNVTKLRDYTHVNPELN